jgi:hypothetical protein
MKTSLDQAVRDIIGDTGRRIIEAELGGERDLQLLAS